MADQSVPRRAQAYVLRTTLVSQADVNVMQDPPTVAAGDVMVSTDGSAILASTNAPALVPAGGRIASVTLSVAEMTGDIVVVAWSDAVGAQWQDQTWVLHPTNSTLAVLAATLVTITADIAALAATLVTVLANIAAVDAIVTAIQIVVNTIQVTANAILVCCNAAVGNILNALLGVSAIAKALRSHDLTIYRGDTWSQQISGMGDLTGRTDIWFGFKVDPSDTDAESIVLISETIGLERINGAAALIPGNGSITVVGADTAGVIQVDLDEVETAKLVPDKRFWDAQQLNAGVVTTPKAGRITISADIVRTVT